MMRRIFGVLLLATVALTGCSKSVSDHQPDHADASNTVPERLIAVLSCTINGASIGVSACLIGGGQTTGGSLKVRSGGSVKQYTDVDLVRENGPTLDIPLTAPFEINAQANSDSGSVLRMVIHDGPKTVYEDEATEFGVIRFDSSSLDQ